MTNIPGSICFIFKRNLCLIQVFPSHSVHYDATPPRVVLSLKWNGGINCFYCLSFDDCRAITKNKKTHHQAPLSLTKHDAYNKTDVFFHVKCFIYKQIFYYFSQNRRKTNPCVYRYTQIFYSGKSEKVDFIYK